MKREEFSELKGDWDYSELPHNIHVGEKCWLERRGSFDRYRSTADPGLTIGNRVRVYTWTTFNVEPGGRVDVGEDSVLVGATFMCADYISIGKRVVISYQVTIADADFHTRNPEERKLDAVANSPCGDPTQRPPYIRRPVVLEDDVWVGIGAIILKGVRIGRGARIGAGAVVTRDVPAGAYVEGNPASVVEERDLP